MSFHLPSLLRGHKLWLKARLLRVRDLWVRVFRSYGEKELLAALRAIGVVRGDALMLHSAFGRSHGFRGSIEQLTDVFIDAVGPDGHLLMVSLPYRTSSFAYLNKLKVFDVRKTPSMMGLVSEMFRLRPDVLRSLHPTHPVLVWGSRAEAFIEGHPVCRYPAGPGSPFDRLAGANGLVVFSRPIVVSDPKPVAAQVVALPQAPADSVVVIRGHQKTVEIVGNSAGAAPAQPQD